MSPYNLLKPNVNYGFMWWLQRARATPGNGRRCVLCSWFCGNFIVVDRKNDLVVVTVGFNKVGEFMKKVVEDGIK
jgi:hypothetical protein